MGIFLKISSAITPYIIYMLMFVLFLSCLKIDINELFRKIKNLKLVIYLTSLILIIAPLLIYPLFKIFLEPEHGLSILILLIMPSGLAIPVYAILFKGDKELALIISIITSLLCPITIPLLILLLTGKQTDVSIVQMFITLSIIILIPFVLSVFFRKLGKKIIKNTEEYYSPVSILIITFIMAGAIAKANFIQNISQSIIYPFLSLFVLAILLQIIGYYAVYKKNYQIKITSSLAIAYMNSTLAIIFAAEFFSPKTLLLVILYQIPVNFALIVFGYIAKKYIYNPTKA